MYEARLRVMQILCHLVIRLSFAATVESFARRKIFPPELPGAGRFVAPRFCTLLSYRDILTRLTVINFQFSFVVRTGGFGIPGACCN